MIAEAMIPIVLFIVLGTVLVLYFWFRSRMRGEMQQTIRTAIDKGQELTPEIIDRLGQPKPRKDRDLRLGIIAVAIALALVSFGALIPDKSDEAMQAMLAISAFPFFIGVAFFVLHKFTGRD